MKWNWISWGLNFLIKLAAAIAVPPVAIKSSIIKILSFLFAAFLWTSISSIPYSSLYFCLYIFPGSLPFFLIGINGKFDCIAAAGPKIKPLASIPAILVILF